MGGGKVPQLPVSVQGVRIAHNSMGKAVGTQATLSLTQAAATVWAFDFCDRLVFPQVPRWRREPLGGAVGEAVAIIGERPAGVACWR
jgi:hypothetical protein